ncbi:hypothetical protein EIJ81_02065 [Aliivibrio salmonicida]|nr:hypothetical protein EIJ81_02065 [Aliivibrio salmonicida]
MTFFAQLNILIINVLVVILITARG